MWVFSIILSIIYLLWLTRLIDFATRTGNRIAVATENISGSSGGHRASLATRGDGAIVATKAAKKH